MFNRENLPGILLLGLCGVVALALLIEIFTDITFTFDGPGWLATAITLAGIGLIGYMSWRAWGSRLRRRRNGGENPDWPLNDVRSPRRSWTNRDKNDPGTP